MAETNEPVGRLPGFADVQAAAERLKPIVTRTPVLESQAVNELFGCRVLIKAECLQRTGSFKLRGAYNKIAQIPSAQRRNGVVAYSSGNHAQGVALAAKLLGVPARIVMPADAPKMKIENTRSHGAIVVPYERKDANRVAIAEQLVAETGGTMVPPYNDPDIMAGQGTLGLEFAAQAEAMGARLDMLLGPTSGGGMISGSAIAFRGTSPATKIYSVEPEGYDDTKQSLDAGTRIELAPKVRSICDGLLVEAPGSITFEILKTHLSGGLVVSDADVERAVKLAFEHYKVVMEPSGAIGLAAVMAEPGRFKGLTVGIIATGGNVDGDAFARMISA
jgi:threonine dehydratase